MTETRTLGRGRLLLSLFGLGDAGRLGPLLLGLDPVGLAGLDRVAVLVEVGAEVVNDLGDRRAQLLLVVLLELAALGNPLQQLGLLGVQADAQVAEELADALGFDSVEKAAGAGVDR